MTYDKVLPRLIAYYLPQYYPIKENDEWWGRGFTEWTNVGKARPLFKGHYQPRIPADLGYYDLRVPQVRIEQAELAKEAGIEGFCYWHYWFGNGKRVLSEVFNDVLKSGIPCYPFCLGWANETWTGIWHGLGRKILIQQHYPGKEDIINHFNINLPAFIDDRYIQVKGKPLFLIYKPNLLPYFDIMKLIWNELAIKNGLKGVYFVAYSNVPEELENLIYKGYDAVNVVRLMEITRQPISRISKIRKMIFRAKKINVFKYNEAIKYLHGPESKRINCFPTIIPNWDNSPRVGKNGFILDDSTPLLFKYHLRDIFMSVKEKIGEENIIFIKSWNEWGEGNYLEPDLRFGNNYIRAIKEELENY